MSHEKYTTTENGCLIFSDVSDWNKLYEEFKDVEVPWVRSNFIEQHLEFFKKFKHKECLCVADGTGDNGLLLASLGINVTATDISTTAIETATKRAQEKGLKNYQMINTETLDYDFGKKFDLIVAIKIQFTTDYSSLHSSMKKILETGGCVAISGFHTEHFNLGERGPPLKELLYTQQDLRKDFDEENFHVIFEGDGVEEFQWEGKIRKQHLVSFIVQEID